MTKRILCSVFFIFTFFLGTIVSAQSRPQVQVADLVNQAGLTSEEAAYLTDRLRSAIGQTPAELIVLRQTDENLTADYLVTGEIISYDDEFRLVLKTHQPTTRNVVAEQVGQAASLKELENTVTEAAALLREQIIGHAGGRSEATPPTVEETPEPPAAAAAVTKPKVDWQRTAMIEGGTNTGFEYHNSRFRPNRGKNYKVDEIDFNLFVKSGYYITHGLIFGPVLGLNQHVYKHANYDSRISTAYDLGLWTGYYFNLQGNYSPYIALAAGYRGELIKNEQTNQKGIGRYFNLELSSGVLLSISELVAIDIGLVFDYLTGRQKQDYTYQDYWGNTFTDKISTDYTNWDIGLRLGLVTFFDGPSFAKAISSSSLATNKWLLVGDANFGLTYGQNIEDPDNGSSFGVNEFFTGVSARLGYFAIAGLALGPAVHFSFEQYDSGDSTSYHVVGMGTGAWLGYYFNRRGWVSPYLSLGGQYDYTFKQFHDPGTREHTHVAFLDLTGGFLLPLAPKWALDLSLLYQPAWTWWKLDLKSTADRKSKSKDHTIRLNVGVAVLF